MQINKEIKKDVKRKGYIKMNNHNTPNICFQRINLKKKDISKNKRNKFRKETEQRGKYQ